MIINNNSVEQINIALLDLEKKLSTIKDDKSAIDSLRGSINGIKASLNETKAGLTSGGTYNINITGNATTATTATTAGSAVSAESAERASKDGNGNSITGTYATKIELADTNNELNIVKKSIVPVGIIYPFGGGNDKVPDGYLPCDGRAVSRTQYSALFNVIGTSFGNGDTINTFNVPDLRECVPVGAGQSTRTDIKAHDVYEVGEFKDDQFQGHKHKIDKPYNNDGAGTYGGEIGNGDKYHSPIPIYANDIYANGTNGNPRVGSTTHGKQIGVNYIIKY